MKILGFDTTTTYLTIAVLDEEKVLARVHEESGLNHCSLLMPAIDKVLKKARLKLKDLNGIAVSIGPGSFTGLRIGVSTCKALSLATGISVVSVPTLDVIAFNYKDEADYIAPLLDAKKNKVYSAFYQGAKKDLKKISGYMLTDIDNLISSITYPIVFFGDGVMKYREYMKAKNPFVKFSQNIDWYPRAEVVAKMGLEKLRCGISEDIDKLAPMYLHPKECNVRGFKC